MFARSQMGRPQKASLAVRDVDGDFILHDDRSGSVHRLNSVAAVIWQLCDGSREPGEIATEVAGVFGQPVAEVSHDVDAILTRFADTGLIEWR
jgi:hypothetical protein